MKKIWFMLASVVVLNLYLNFNHITRIFSDKILGVQVLSAEEIDSLCEGKEDAYLEPFLTLDGGRIAYDAEQNMLLIPQKMSGEDFHGVLRPSEGRLYFAQDAAFADKSAAMRSNQVFR